MASNTSPKKGPAKGKKSQAYPNHPYQSTAARGGTAKIVGGGEISLKKLRRSTDNKSFKVSWTLVETISTHAHKSHGLIIYDKLPSALPPAFLHRYISHMETSSGQKRPKEKVVINTGEPVASLSMPEMIDSLYQLLEKTTDDQERTDLIHTIGKLEAQLEEMELALNPAQWAELKKTVAHFARRAQDSFSPEWQE